MGRYAGEIQIRNNNGFFVNFYPGYEIKNGQFHYLTDSDIQKILPGSKYLNLNLCSTSPLVNLEEIFQDGDDIVIDFEQEDLQENMNSAKMRYQTAWKLDVSRSFSHVVHRMEDLGWYCVADAHDLEGDWRSDKVVEVVSSNINPGMQIMVEDPQDNTILAGPFMVHYNKMDDSLYIRPESDGSRYMIRGRQYPADYHKYMLVLEQQDVTRHYIRADVADSSELVVDLISDEELLESFRQVFSKRCGKTNRVEFSQLEEMLGFYRTSLLSSGNASQAAVSQRFSRLKEMFNAQKNMDQAVQSVTSISLPLLSQCGSDKNVAALIEQLTEHPDFLSRIPGFASLEESIEERRKTMEQMEEEIARLQEKQDELVRLQPEEKLALFQARLDQMAMQETRAREELSRILSQTHMAEELADMEERKNWLDEEIARRHNEQASLERQIADLEQRLDEVLSRSAQKALEFSFDSLLSSRLTLQTARLEREKERQMYANTARAIRALPHTWLEKEDLVSYLVQSVQQYRPDFQHNDIINLFACLSQGFLTIFCGDPGTGKSSIVRIAASVLGMNEPQSRLAASSNGAFANRFVHVSVERGWNSSRDFIGWNNTLTHTFDKANRQIFDLLSILDEEARVPSNETGFPSLILLDNANLSSMEYYWADFLSLSEEEDSVRGTINLGEDYELSIPETLHFAATINTDHTTEPLSSRLLDRSWVIRLPEHELTLGQPLNLAFMPRELVGWDKLKEVFQPGQQVLYLPEEAEEAFSQAVRLFKKCGLPISTRAQLAVRRYVLAASRWMQTEEDKSPAMEALDYAVLQRVLPQISGSGEHYRRGLEQILEFVQEKQMERCAKAIDDILEKGDESMQYYQFVG